MKKICDLHTHSVFSDGTYSPTELIDEAIKIGLSAIALCDHNTVEGVPEFISAALGKNIDAIAGAEFSVDYQGTELHLLGLYLPEKSFPQISDLMSDVYLKKEQSYIALAESLNKAGYNIDYQKIKSKTPNGRVNRAHFAAELTLKGYTESVKQAFETLLSKNGGHYTEPERPAVWEMIDFILNVGATPVLAHPFLSLSGEELTVFLPKAKAAGLAGMECIYSTYDSALTEKSFNLADTFGLKYSGGSDFHGEIKPDIMLGTGKNNLCIPYEYALALRP